LIFPVHNFYFLYVAFTELDPVAEKNAPSPKLILAVEKSWPQVPEFNFASKELLANLITLYFSAILYMRLAKKR